MSEPHPFRLCQASVAYRKGEGGVHLAMDGVTLRVNPGDFVAVVGANGSGKSTLIRVLAGLLPLSKGERTEGWLTGRRYAAVLQNPDAQLLGETAEEDIRFSLELAGVPAQNRAAELAAVLKECGLSGLEQRPLRRLSSGQKQLAAVAGALAAHAGLLLFDEATAFLDSAESERLLRLARSLCGPERAVVWVTQKPEEAARADRVWALQAGKAVFDGPPAAFFYPGDGDESVCGRLGLAEPYPVRLARGLQARGITLKPPPLTSEAFLERLRELRTGGIGRGEETRC